MTNENEDDSSIVCLDIPHIRQKHSWDCGIICTLMLIRACGHSTTTAQDLMASCGTESVWTIDLAHLIRRFGFAVDFFTLTLGPNPAFATEQYYANQMLADEGRVAHLFATSAKNGIRIEQRSLSVEELSALLVGDNNCAIIVLVDKRRFLPTCSLGNRSNSSRPAADGEEFEASSASSINDGDETRDTKAFFPPPTSGSGCEMDPGPQLPRVVSEPPAPKKPKFFFPSFSPAEAMVSTLPSMAYRSNPGHLLVSGSDTRVDPDSRDDGERAEGCPMTTTTATTMAAKKKKEGEGEEEGNNNNNNNNSYVGHYVLLVGFDRRRREFLVRDPAATAKDLWIGEAALDAARRSFGTDEDMLVVRHPALASSAGW